MATTALKIEKPDTITYSRFMTVQITEEEMEVCFYLCNPNYAPIATVQPVCQIQKGTEKDFHSVIRKHAKEKGHYIPEESTNVEWDLESTNL